MWQRYNQISHIFEKSVDNGVTWGPLPLNASIINEGTLPLPANIAYTDVSNSFSIYQRLRANIPQLVFIELAAPLESKVFDIVGSSQLLSFRALSDNLGVLVSSPLTLNRSGDAAIGRHLQLSAGGMLRWGTTTSSAALRGNGASVEVVTGDNTQYAVVRGLSFNSISTGNNLADLTVGPIISSSNIVSTGVYYPGRIDVTGQQSTWYLASHGGYGLYCNTGLHILGQIWEQGRTTALGVSLPWTPVLYGYGGGPIGGSITGRYTIVGKTVFWSIYIINFVLPAAVVELDITPLPGSLLPISSATENNSMRLFNPGVGDQWAYGWVSNDNWLRIRTTGNINAGTGHIMGQGWYTI